MFYLFLILLSIGYGISLSSMNNQISFQETLDLDNLEGLNYDLENITINYHADNNSYEIALNQIFIDNIYLYSRDYKEIEYKRLNLLLARGANPNINFQRDNPLLIAIRAKNINLTKFLLNNDAIVNFENGYGDTPLIAAVKANCLKLVNLLIRHNSQIDYKNHYGDHPLLIAIKENYIDIAKVLIKNGADTNLSDKFLKTPVIYAVLNNNIKLLKLLFFKGADLSVRDNNKLSALSYAIINRNFPITEFLLNNGANMDCYDFSGQHILFYIIENNYFDLAKLLIEKGLNFSFLVKQDSCKEISALNYAVLLNKKDIADLLFNNSKSC